MNPLLGRTVRARSFRRAAGVALTLAVLLCGGSLAHAGLIITPTFDSSITSDPNAASIESTINQAINFYETTYSNPVKVNILFQEMSSGLGHSKTLVYNITYTNFRNGLAANQAISGQADQLTALNNLPTGPNNPVTGNTSLGVRSPDARVLGQATPFLYDSSGNVGSGGSFIYDGIIGLNTSITTPGSPGSTSQFSLLATTEHEIDEVLGLGSSLPNAFNPNSPFFGEPFGEDLYRYDNSGNRSFTTNSSAKAFFSIDGTTLLAQFDNQNDGGDFGDWQSNPLPPGVQPKVQDAFATPFASPSLNANSVEATGLDVLGYNRISSQIPPPPLPSRLRCCCWAKELHFLVSPGATSASAAMRNDPD